MDSNTLDVVADEIEKLAPGDEDTINGFVVYRREVQDPDEWHFDVIGKYMRDTRLGLTAHEAARFVLTGEVGR